MRRQGAPKLARKHRKLPSKLRRVGPKSTRARKNPGSNAGSRTEAAVAARMDSWMDERASALKKGLFEDGYFIMDLPNRFRVRGFSLRLLTHFVSHNAMTRYIFQKNAHQDGSCNTGDGKRKMLVRTKEVVDLASKQTYLSQNALIEDLVFFKRDLVRRAYGSETITGNTPSLLLSEPLKTGAKSSDQVLHPDGHTTAEAATKQAADVRLDNPVSFSSLTSFQGCSLTVIKGSHLEVRKMSQDKTYTPAATMYGETVSLKPNQAIFFTQDLIHAGDGYAVNNLRFHMYFDHVNVPREADATNPLPKLFGTQRAAVFQRSRPLGTVR